MNTYTIRNRSARSPIVTFRPTFFARLLEAEPDASNLTIHVFKHHYEWLMPQKRVSIDYTQKQKLLERYGAVDEQWTSKYADVDSVHHAIKDMFTTGITKSSEHDLNRILDISISFFKMFDLLICSDRNVSPQLPNIPHTGTI